MKQLIKLIASIAGFLLLAGAVLATPIAVGYGIYDWAANDVLFKHALWSGFKLWVAMIGLGIFVGTPLYVSAK